MIPKFNDGVLQRCFCGKIYEVDCDCPERKAIEESCRNIFLEEFDKPTESGLVVKI